MSLLEEALLLQRAAHDLMYLGMDGSPRKTAACAGGIEALLGYFGCSACFIAETSFAYCLLWGGV